MRLAVIAASRSFADDPDASAWVKLALERILGSLPEGSSVLSGGGDGPETWMREMCRARAIKLVEYRRDGMRWEDGKITGQLALDRTLGMSVARKKLIVASALAAARRGWDVSCNVLVDSNSDSSGARELIALAREASLDVSELVYMQPRTDRDIPVVWTDTETTGLTAGRHSVIELASVMCDPSSRRVLGTFEARIQLESWMAVEPVALEVNGYSIARWRDARDGKTVFAEWLAWLPPKFTFAGHNCPFDRGFIKADSARHGLPEPGWLRSENDIDTKRTVERVLRKTGRTPNAKLVTACDFYGIPNIGAHTALSDAHRARLVHLALMGESVAQHVAAVTE